MYIKAVIEHGEIKLLEPVKLKHDKVNIKLIIPDNEVVKTSEIVNDKKDKLMSVSNKYADFSPQIQQMMHDLDEIRNRPIDDSEIPDLTEEQQQRMDAFSYRNEFESE